MKVKIICGALVACAEGQRNLMPDIPSPRPRPQDGERRYKQLTKMMAFFNQDFDERKYWTYGCQCLILGDRPMSDPGHGQPVDALDQVCKEYKDCLKCARMEYGDWCIGEFYKYDYRRNKRTDEIQCRDDPNAFDQEVSQRNESGCKRKLCECDAAFARAHVDVKHHFNRDYHLFWSTKANGWEPQEECIRTPGGPHDPQCCGTPTTPSVLYNAKKKQCCPDGTVKSQC